MLHQIFDGTRKVTLDDVQNPLFWIDTIRDVLYWLVAFIPRLIVAAAFLLFFWLVYRGLRRLAVASMKSAHVDESIRDLITRLIKWTVMGFAAVIAANQVGIQITALLTGVSIVGLAVSFAAQETIANFIAGIVIFWDKPFRVGDYVEIDAVYGQVERVTFRSTRLLTGAGEIVVFPNTAMLATRLSNHTAHPHVRVRVDITIGYDASIDAAREVLLSTLAGDERVAADPAPSVGVAECSARGVVLALNLWVGDKSIEKLVKGEYLEKAKKALDGAGIAIPYPHLHVVLPDPQPGPVAISEAA